MMIYLGQGVVQKSQGASKINLKQFLYDLDSRCTCFEWLCLVMRPSFGGNVASATWYGRLVPRPESERTGTNSHG